MAFTTYGTIPAFAEPSREFGLENQSTFAAAWGETLGQEEGEVRWTGTFGGPAFPGGLRRAPEGLRPAGADANRRLVLPAADRAFWRAPAGFAGPLQYLAWGTRQDESGPANESRLEGWSYVVVESGNPTLVRAGRRDCIAAPSLLLIGPDCAHCWQTDAHRGSKLLMWMWRQPVHPGLARMRRDAVVRLQLAAAELADLRHLHALTRNEIHRGDLHSEPALSGLQVLLEARIARIGDGAGDPREETVERALNWIEAHMTTRQPLARLADFLGVSPATVQRLFRERLGTTVMKCIAEIRRREAERMLMAKGMTVKEVAYRLGYRHPHDFSRAFRNHTGKLPSRRKFGSGGVSRPACVEAEFSR